MRDLYITRSSMPEYDEFTEAIKPLWQSHWLTNMGRFHKELEDELRVFLKVEGLSLMVNGHMALELAIQMFSFPVGAEVITTPFTFISTTHAIIRSGLTPVFCDIKDDGTIDEAKIESLITSKTVAILPVHVFGHVCNVMAIQQIADRYNLKVIYDAAHAFGEEYSGRGIGDFGDASVFSFHATKVFNTIEGGAVAFHDANLYKKLYNLKNFGIQDEETVTEVGANAKMNEFCAIMGLCNLKHIDEAIKSRRKVHECYLNELADIDGISILIGSSESTLNYGYFPILVKDGYSVDRDKLYDLMKQKKIFTRKYFSPLTCDQECFGDKYNAIDIPNARGIAKRILALPIYEGMTVEDVKRVIDVIRWN